MTQKSYFKFSRFFSANHHASWSKQKIEKSEQCVIVCNQAYNFVIIRHKSCVSNPLGTELVAILDLKSFRLTSSNFKVDFLLTSHVSMLRIFNS